MTVEELKELANKVSSGQASAAERLILIKEFNNNINGLRRDLLVLKNNKDLEAVRANLNNSKL